MRELDTAAINATIPGLHYDLFKPARNFEGRVPDFSKIQPTSSGTVDAFIFPAKAEKQPGFRFSGYISVPKDGLYTFYLQSDAESRLYIGDRKIVQGNRNEAFTYDGYHMCAVGWKALTDR